MRKTVLPPVLVKHFLENALALVLMASLALLAACQRGIRLASSSPTASPAASLTITPANLNLGSVAVGTSQKATATLTAGAASVTVTGVSTTDSAVFTVGGLTVPITLAAGESKSFGVTFSPKVSGTANAALTISSSAPTVTSSLTGIGTVVGTHTVKLSWNASTSPNITGYNVYRSPYASSCGSLLKINGVLNTTTLYADAGVADGASYCYATTAVDASQLESAFSNIVSNVRIPTT